MVAPPPLTQGAVARIWNGQSVFEPVLQCVQLKSFSTNAGGQECWKMQLSDGATEHTLPTLLATPMVDQFVRPGLLRPGSVVTLKEFLINKVNGRKFAIALNLDAHGERPIQGIPVDIQKGIQTALPAAPIGGASCNGLGKKQAPLQFASLRSDDNDAIHVDIDPTKLAAEVRRKVSKVLKEQTIPRKWIVQDKSLPESLSITPAVWASVPMFVYSLMGMYCAAHDGSPRLMVHSFAYLRHKKRDALEDDFKWLTARAKAMRYVW